MNDEGLKLIVDANKINAMLRELSMSCSESKTALKRALGASARVIQKQGKANLGSVVNAASGTPLKADSLKKYVRYKVYRDATGVRVHIQKTKGKNKSYILKFLEEGTQARFNKRRKRKVLWDRRLSRKRYTGFIAPSHFFSKAVKQKKNEAEMSLQSNIEKYIQKIAAKRK